MDSRIESLRCNKLFLLKIFLTLQFLTLLPPPAFCQSGLTPSMAIEQLNHKLNALSGHALDAASEAAAHDLAKQRRDLVLALLTVSPGEAKELMLEAGTVAALPASAQAYLEHDVEESGGLAVLVEDYAQAHRTRYFLEKNGERLELYFGGVNAPTMISGARVQVHGKRLDDSLLVGEGGLQVVTAAPVPNTFGPQSTAVLLVNFQDDTEQPFTTTQVRDVVFGTTSSFFAENSQNQTWLTGDIFGWFTIPLSVKACPTLYALVLAVNQVVAATQLDLSKYNHLIYVLPPFGCTWLGAGTVGGNPSAAAINGDLMLDIVGHEMGHNFGLYHSHSLVCPGATLGTNCIVDEYGDRFDIMGQWTASHFNAFQKERLGWLNYGSSLPITLADTTGVYSIAPYETSSGTKAIKVLQSNGAPVGQRSYYYIEYRQLIGFDSVLSQYPASTTGVLIRSGGEGDPDSSQLLNMSPQDSSFAHAALTVGQTFADPVGGVSVKTVSADQSGATVDIERFSGTGCSHSAPQLMVTPTKSAAVSAGALVHYTVTITNPDSLACSNSSFLLVATVPTDPANWSVVSVTNYFTLLPGEAASTDLQVTSPTAAASGDYTVNVSAVAWPNFALRTDTAVTYTISGVSVPDFLLAVTPSNITVQRGTSGSFSVNTTAIGGFSSSVSFSASGLPFGMTAQFVPATIPAPGSGSSTLTVSAGASAVLGTTTITVTGSGGQQSHTADAEVSVTSAPPPLTSIAVTPVNPMLAAGSSLQFHATGTYSDNSTKDLTNQVNWNSDTPTVATISNVSGFAQAVAAGSTKISASLNAVSGSTTLTVTSTPPPPGNTYTLLGNDIPASRDVTYAQGVEVGLKFSSDVPGSIAAIRFYKSTNNFGMHVGELWTITGQLLASAPFVNETSSGWQQVNLPTPVAIQANTGYVVSYHSQGPLSYVDFPSSIDNPPLHAPASGILGGNGVYRLGPVGTFPALGGGENYLVDVVLSMGTESTALTSIAVTPVNPMLAAGSSLQFHATGTYSDNSTKDLTNQVNWNSDTPTVATISNVSGFAQAVAAGSTKIAASLNAVSGSTTLTVTSTPPPPGNTYTLLGNDIPASRDVTYAQGVEVGLKFSSDVPGSITAIRFYKSTNNFGMHVGELWTITGQLLASAPFVNETSSGWQQVNLPTPMAIQANTGYVVSYHSQGPLSYVDFPSSIDNPPLHAPASGILGGNGVYRLGPVGTFPALGGGENYLVDVVFTP